jgi:hypothetical protein
MIDLRLILPASPTTIRAWLTGFVLRILPIDPSPSGYGEPDFSPQACLTDATLREQEILAEIEQAGGFCVGLELAYYCKDGQMQPMGPVIVFMCTPMGPERSDVSIFFPLGTSIGSHQRVIQELSSDWPGIEIRNGSMPWWFGRGLNLRELFESIATGGPPLPGAPPRVAPNSSRPWRQTSARPTPSSVQIAGDAALSPQDEQMVRLWTLEGKTGPEIADKLSLSASRVRNRLSELRKVLGEDKVPSRARPRRTPRS